MTSEQHLASEEARNASQLVDEEATPFHQWLELLSAVVLALATVATAWCGYQAARWNGEQTVSFAQATAANIKVAQLTNVAEQRLSLHVALFGQWLTARTSGNTALADWLFARFPAPLDAASSAWLATQPLTNQDAPATPFEMPQYVLAERIEAQRWEAAVAAAGETANRASNIADRYLMFTIIFASVLFFAGISGKFQSRIIDLMALGLGILALVGGVLVLVMTPIK